MAYRNGTYVAFHAGGTTDPTKSDIKYYNTMKMWDASKHIEFSLCNSHEKTSSVRDSSKKETLKRSLITRLRNSKQFLLILTKTTKNDTDWVPFEIAYAVDTCELPLILAYPDYDSIMAPAELSDYWSPALKTRIENGSARAIHIPFRKAAVLDALSQFDITNKNYPTNGYGYYTREAHQEWGLV
ncbi:TIR domain-containing protein [Zhongshania aquimaris]|uniref:TIR domain-containing protein n=1 Tax=Zhongshania aquimaris TaxID=2857107 RepID=A0ABS6VWI8_9GAMM|nr:TIR domain-containing protein [Zhongshania aquimaris]MBW2941996.1 TIR domain-containing protein [Zhongshania aquimaris]